jgi:hypothetical protein
LGWDAGPPRMLMVGHLLRSDGRLWVVGGCPASVPSGDPNSQRRRPALRLGADRTPAGSLSAGAIAITLPAALLPGPLGPLFSALRRELQPAPRAQGPVVAVAAVRATGRRAPPAGGWWELPRFAEPIPAGAFGRRQRHVWRRLGRGRGGAGRTGNTGPGPLGRGCGSRGGEGGTDRRRRGW